MTNSINYEKIGLKCGIEMHGQLNTKKLFCSCKGEETKESDISIIRKLRKVVGENDVVDFAALKEEQKNKIFEYRGNSEINTCLVELDEEPPHNINKKALETSISIAKFLKCYIPDKIQVMRKIVIDGSNTSGFQRTALIGSDGDIKTSYGNVRVSNLMLEEDACKVIERTNEKTIYDLYRLGIPLIEISTYPDIHNPYQFKEIAEKLGMLLRLSGRAKRGLGSIRQDVNVSIIGGERVELKGVQDLRTIPKVIDAEIIRQQNIIKISKKYTKIPEIKSKDLTKLFSKTNSKLIRKSLNNHNHVFGIKITNMRCVLGEKIQPGKTWGKEIADYLKAHIGLKGILHRDELPNYGITEKEVEHIVEKLKCSLKDNFALVLCKKEQKENMEKLFLERIEQLLKGVPMEVRKSNPDLTSSYLRPMPGHSRLYPETDVDIINPPEVEALEDIDKLVKNLEKKGLNRKQIYGIIKEGKYNLFDKILTNYKFKPAFIYDTIISLPKEIEKKEKITIPLNHKHFLDLFELLKKGKINKDILYETMSKLNRNEKITFDNKKIDDKDIEKEIKSIIKKSPTIPIGAVMGQLMKKYKGKVNGKKLMELVKKNMR